MVNTLSHRWRHYRIDSSLRPPYVFYEREFTRGRQNKSLNQQLAHRDGRLESLWRRLAAAGRIERLLVRVYDEGEEVRGADGRRVELVAERHHVRLSAHRPRLEDPDGENRQSYSKSTQVNLTVNFS